MQRIDENTYIDDTLVTCAEYQLFIDEMREQGKYHQPDHWTSYQFPEGQAREPILGVRHSDAIAFCEWLTSRDEEEWKYRLPTLGEADTFLMNSLEKTSCGYWIGDDYQFRWVGAKPKEVPKGGAIPELIDILTKDPRVLDCNHIIDNAIEIGDILLRASDRVSITRDFYDTRDHSRARGYDRNRTHDLDRDLINIEDRFFNLDRMRKGFETLTIDFYSKENRLIIAARDLSLKIDFVRDVCIDISTLFERIKGTSPAFEGIRLVKERIR